MPAPSDPAALGALYQELILDHYRRPRNKGEPADADAHVALKNPLCGDTVADVKFAGRGCSISQSSASMMTELVRGKTVPEAQALLRRVAELLGGSVDAATDPSLGDLRALSGVARFPMRVKCAALAWRG